MPPWEAQATDLDNDQGRRVTILSDGAPLTFAGVLDGWRNDPGFRSFYISTLAKAPFEALFWETPALTRHTLDRPYECVLVDSPQLARVQADPVAFRNQFGPGCDQDNIAIFTNLGNDALLVVPCPSANDSHYAHLASFLRYGPTSQAQALFGRLGDVLDTRLGEQPVWVSTSGLGVYWLHIRLDDRPKYYTYAPYRTTS